MTILPTQIMVTKASHSHINFVGSIQGPLKDDNGHHTYLVRT